MSLKMTMRIHNFTKKSIKEIAKSMIIKKNCFNMINYHELSKLSI